jgi:hypothetical protein
VTSKTFTRDELAAAFEKFEATVDRAAQTRDWDPWVEQYSPDVTYVEHAEDDGDLSRQLHDVVPVAVVGDR